MYRLLNHGGRLFLVVHGIGYLPDYLFTRSQLLKVLSISMAGSGTKGAKFLTQGSLRRKLEATGFRSIRFMESKDWMFAGRLPVYYGITARKL